MVLLFATNRALASDFTFTANPELPGVIHWGDAAITAGDDPTARVTEVATGAPPPDLVERLVSAPSDQLLITLHGFGYSFDESMVRAGALGDWFAQGVPSAEPSVIAFAWPSAGDIDPIHYVRDYEASANSAPAFLLFMRQLIPLIAKWRAAHPQGRVTLLAHSMGNHFLHAGLEGSFGDGYLDLAGNAGLFDLALLAAGDENHRALDAPNGLYMLLTLARRTVVLFNRADIALDISRDIHLVDRIGHVGARDKTSLRDRPIAFVDCRAVENFLADPEGHQYYRTVPAVRDLICAELVGRPAMWQGSRAAYRPASNDWELELHAAAGDAGVVQEAGEIARVLAGDA